MRIERICWLFEAAQDPDLRLPQRRMRLVSWLPWLASGCEQGHGRRLAAPARPSLLIRWTCCCGCRPEAFNSAAIDDLQRVLGLPARPVHCWAALLAFRWYGDSPRDGLLALVSTAQAQPSCRLSFGLWIRMSGQRWCASGPRPRSRDWADLQHGCSFPLTLVEG